MLGRFGIVLMGKILEIINVYLTPCSVASLICFLFTVTLSKVESALFILPVMGTFVGLGLFIYSTHHQVKISSDDRSNIEQQKVNGAVGYLVSVADKKFTDRGISWRFATDLVKGEKNKTFIDNWVNLEKITTIEFI